MGYTMPMMKNFLTENGRYYIYAYAYRGYVNILRA